MKLKAGVKILEAFSKVGLMSTVDMHPTNLKRNGQ
jgi:hypothetical protein